jgi:hypothetical protein
MAPSKVIDRTSPAVIPTGAPPIKTARLHPFLRLFLLVALNSIITTILWTSTTEFLGNELGTVHKPEQGLVEAMARLFYKIGAVWAGWWLSYDCKHRQKLCVSHY